MKDVRGSACFENCETEFSFLRRIRQGGIEAPVLWGRFAKHVLWKVEKEMENNGWSIMFGGEREDEHLFSGMMWVVNNWIFSHKDELT